VACDATHIRVAKSYGGGCGTVFEVSPALGGGWTEEVLYSFARGTDGCVPFGGLLRDVAGNLYGTTNACGAFTKGTVFEIATSGTETGLYSFGPIAVSPGRVRK
jgi:hypothetical protein